MQSLVITNHIKAGNIEIAKNLISELDNSERNFILKSVNSLLSKKYRLSANDVDTLKTKRKLLLYS